MVVAEALSALLEAANTAPGTRSMGAA